MKTATKIMAVAAMVAMAWAGPGFAQQADRGGNRACDPAGTWFGQNETYGFEFLFTVVPMGGGCYSAVAEGVANDVPPWEYATSWRGTIQKIRGRTYEIVQLQYAGPSQLSDPQDGVPDIAGAQGELTMLDCDHFEVEFAEIGIYAWGQTPFVDVPVATYPPSFATYTRVPGSCKEKKDNQ